MERDEEKRLKFIEQISKIAPEDIVYVDESGLDHRDKKDYGWSKKGEIIFCDIKGSCHKRTTLISGISQKNILGFMTFNCNTDTSVFLKWLENGLIPTLKQGQYIILDNASFHKSIKIKEMIENAGCKLIFLPPYSPDLNPIEKYWAWFKKQMKKLKLVSDNIYENIKKVLKIKY